ncbi:GuaB1 family IMP dehydrogenase-related protein, partial [Candidatus Uhrbacteria bacterium]|nr:GuaB1 family IMP dehydrogenase-related protein [Candidatus Uhrbacteria bacterium]
MRFLNLGTHHPELTYDDVFLMPQYSDIDSRMDVDLTPMDKVGANLPIVVANMTAVAGRRMSETVTRRGGLVILPQDMALERIQDIVTYLKSCHPVFETPVVLDETDFIQKALNLIHKRAHGATVVVDGGSKPVGIFTERDAEQKDRFLQMKDVMTRNMITMPDSATPQEIFKKLHDTRVTIIPLIKQDGRLSGVLTTKGAVRSTLYKPAVNVGGQLLTAVALGLNKDLENKVERLLEMGVDVFVLDTAHGHQRKMLEAITVVRGIIGSGRTLAAGNVVTAQATEDFIKAGANIVKVGVGPGAVCITRMATAMGRPQFSAVAECSAAARSLGAHVWADGGIRHPRDVVLALAAGASAAFFGSWFAGTYESPGDIQYDADGRMYKENFGMASRRAVSQRSREDDAFVRARKEYFEEGISVSRMYLRRGEESAEDIIDKIAAGLRSACTYAGA